MPSDTSAPIRLVRHSGEAATARHAPIALWRVMQALLGTLYALFGAPEDVAREHTFTTKAHAQLASWLRSAEALLRRLLLIEASVYPKPNTRLAPPKPGEGGPLLKPARRRALREMSFTPDAAQEWRVTFRCFSSSPAGSGGSPEARSGKGKGQLAPSDAFGVSSPTRGGDKKRFHSAWPLAERYEALIRVFNDPTAYARRLARKLHALPHRLGEVLRADADAPHRIDRYEELTHEAEHAWRPHFSTA